jgi:hypothetical protein
MSAQWKLLAALALIGAASSGCGVSSWVTAPESTYPISMSSGLRDQSGELVTSERMTEVGKFTQSYKACSMAWRLISFTGDKDISEEINQQVSTAKGDGVTDLSVTSSATVWTMTTLIGIFPDCANVEIRGSIVKVSGAAAPVHAAR